MLDRYSSGDISLVGWLYQSLKTIFSHLQKTLSDLYDKKGDEALDSQFSKHSYQIIECFIILKLLCLKMCFLLCGKLLPWVVMSTKFMLMTQGLYKGPLLSSWSYIMGSKRWSRKRNEMEREKKTMRAEREQKLTMKARCWEKKTKCSRKNWWHWVE